MSDADARHVIPAGVSDESVNGVVELVTDASPVQCFIDLLKLRLETTKCLLDFGNLGFELVRIEQVLGPADTGKVFITLYPSDRFLSYAAALLAGNTDLLRVE